MRITREELFARGWVERGGIMIRYGSPRLGWKEDGTFIVGFHEWPQKVTTFEQMDLAWASL